MPLDPRRCGGSRSPIGRQSDLDDLPDADADGVDDLDAGVSQSLAAGIATVSSDCTIPLSDQGAVDREACRWGEEWATESCYQEPDFAHGAVDKLPNLLVHTLRDAAATFPAGTGLGCCNLAPRAFTRLSDAASQHIRNLFPCCILKPRSQLISVLYRVSCIAEYGSDNR